MAQVAEAMSDVFGRPISYVPASEETLRQGYAARGVPRWLAEIALGIERAMEAGRHAEPTTELTDLIQAAPRTIEIFLRDYRQSFEKTSATTT
jgi:hypothetical protein